MKADVIIAFYDQHPLWQHVVWGLNANKAHISTVFVSKDGLYEPGERDLLLIPLKDYGINAIALEHPHIDFGHPKSIKQGAEAATSEYIIWTDGDVILAPHAVELILEDTDETTLVYGLSHDVERPPSYDSLPNPKILREELRDPGRITDNRERWQLSRDIFACANRSAYFAMGGHDTAYHQYGFTDYDVAMRWMMHYGHESVELGRGLSWHMSNLGRGSMWGEDSEARFKAVLRRLYGQS